MIPPQDRSALAIVDHLAQRLAELVEVGRRLVGTSEDCLALMRKAEACGGSVAVPTAEPDQDPMPIANLSESRLPLKATTSLLLTHHEVAELLRIEDRTFRRWRNDPAMKFPKSIQRGRVLRWRRHDIERWIERRQA